MVKNYRGKIQRYDLTGYSLLAFGLLLVIIMGVGASKSPDGWGNMVLYIMLYFIMCPIIYKISKCFQCKYLR
jgi:hypothetical protein